MHTGDHPGIILVSSWYHPGVFCNVFVSSYLHWLAGQYSDIILVSSWYHPTFIGGKACPSSNILAPSWYHPGIILAIGVSSVNILVSSCRARSLSSALRVKSSFVRKKFP